MDAFFLPSSFLYFMDKSVWLPVRRVGWVKRRASILINPHACFVESALWFIESVPLLLPRWRTLLWDTNLIFGLFNCWAKRIKKMLLRYLLRLWLLYLVMDLLYCYCVRCLLLGYEVVYIYAPYLVQYGLFPGPECNLELCEEILDIDCCANCLKRKLSKLPASEPESDSAPKPDSGSDVIWHVSKFANFCLGIQPGNKSLESYHDFSFNRWAGGSTLQQWTFWFENSIMSTSLGFQPEVWACLPMQVTLAPAMLPWSLAESSAPLYPPDIFHQI